MKKLRSTCGVGFLLFGMVFCISGYAQTQETIDFEVVERNIFTKSIGVKEGLPSSETYNVFQDSKGYMWISTDRGLARYNGVDMKVFTVQDGLPDNVVFELFEDSQGWIWIESMNGKASYIRNDTVHLLDSLQEQLKLDFYPSQYYNITEDEKGNIWFGYNREIGKLTRYDKKNGKLSAINLDTSGHNLNVYVKNFKNKNYIYPISDRQKNDTTYRVLNSILSVFNDSTERHIPIDIKEHLENGFGSRVTKSKDGIYVFTVFDYVLVCKLTLQGYSIVSLPFSNNVSCVKFDALNNLWVGIINQGVYKFESEDYSNAVQFLKGYTVSGVCLDTERGYWFSTVEQGVKYCSNIKFKFPILLPLESRNNVTEMISCESAIQIGLQNGEIYTCHSPDSLLFTNIGSDIFHLICKQDSLFSKASKKQEETYRKWHYWGDITHSKLLSDFSFIDGYFDEELNVSWNGSLLQVKLNNEVVWSRITDSNSRIQSVVNSTEGLYVGTASELLLYNPQLKILEQVNQKPIDAVKLLFHEKEVLIATKGDGVHSYKNGVITKLNINLPNQSCNDMELFQNKLYVATGSGIVIVSLDDYSCNQITENYGLPSNEVAKIEIFDHHLWAASPKNVTAIPLDITWENTVAPNVWVESMMINDTIVYTNQKLKHTENNISVALANSTYKGGSKKEYQYKFSEDTQWRSYSGDELAFINLPPNDYLLEIKAVNADGVSSIKPAKVEFTIMAPWYATSWFVAGAAGFMMLLIYLVLKARSVAAIKKIEKEEGYKRKISEMELKALRSQMNPHFLFNAINSIQYFLVKNRSGEAKDYLSKFSLLVRNVLNHSRQDFITLKEEINGLKLYMDIEKLRFENEFSYEIQVDDELDFNFDKIPVMIVQPFIENAIWHGIMQKKKGHGKIVLKFDVQDDFMVVTISDNGIGRVASEWLKQQRLTNKRTSLGLQIIKERINLFNTYRTNKMKFTTIDLKSNDGEALGTKVVIYIPFS